MGGEGDGKRARGGCDLRCDETCHMRVVKNSVNAAMTSGLSKIKTLLLIEHVYPRENKDRTRKAER
jgi:hypothetical protein